MISAGRSFSIILFILLLVATATQAQAGIGLPENGQQIRLCHFPAIDRQSACSDPAVHDILQDHIGRFAYAQGPPTAHYDIDTGEQVDTSELWRGSRDRQVALCKMAEVKGVFGALETTCNVYGKPEVVCTQIHDQRGRERRIGDCMVRLQGPTLSTWDAAWIFAGFIGVIWVGVQRLWRA